MFAYRELALIEAEIDLLASQAEDHLTGPDIADVRARVAAIRAARHPRAN